MGQHPSHSQSSFSQQTNIYVNGNHHQHSQLPPSMRHEPFKNIAIETGSSSNLSFSAGDSVASQQNSTCNEAFNCGSPNSVCLQTICTEPPLASSSPLLYTHQHLSPITESDQYNSTNTHQQQYHLHYSQQQHNSPAMYNTNNASSSNNIGNVFNTINTATTTIMSSYPTSFVTETKQSDLEHNKIYDSFGLAEHLSILNNNSEINSNNDSSIHNSSLNNTNNSITNNNDFQNSLLDSKVNSVSNESLNLFSGSDHSVLHPPTPHLPPLSPTPHLPPLSPTSSFTQLTSVHPQNGQPYPAQLVAMGPAPPSVEVNEGGKQTLQQLHQQQLKQQRQDHTFHYQLMDESGSLQHCAREDIKSAWWCQIPGTSTSQATSHGDCQMLPLKSN